MSLQVVGLFVIGAALLIAGAELLVRGASRLAGAAGISPLVVGLTVVAFGTSSPELAVTVGSAVTGQTDLALGNVVGSNVFNVLFILGLAALIVPLVVDEQLVRLDVPLMVAASVLVLLLGLDGAIGRPDGLALVAGLLVYTGYLISRSRRRTVRDEDPAGGGGSGRPSPALDVGFVVAGLGLLVLGARWMVGAAVDAATALGVSSLVIGLTVVAAGTSLPEVATSVLAALRGQRDIAVGNVVGSGIFNLLAVLGLGGVVAPRGLPVPPGALSFDIPVMIAVAVATLPIFFTGYVIARWEGAVLLGYYVSWTAYLVLDATRHDRLTAFGAAMVWFVIPLTAVTLAVVVVRTLRDGPGRDQPGDVLGVTDGDAADTSPQP